MDQTLIQQLKNYTKIKNTPTGISELLILLSQNDLDIDELIEHLMRFPVISVRIVMVANSSWASPKVEITNVKQACLQLGLTMVKSMSIALLISQQFDTQKCRGFSEQNYWIPALVCADLMAINAKIYQLERGTAYLVGLIHNISLLAIADLQPSKLNQAIILAGNTEMSLSKAIESTFEVSFLKATQVILELWNLPLSLTHAFVKSSLQSDYYELFIETQKDLNHINLYSSPISAMDKDEIPDLSEALTSILNNAESYSNLCKMYCR